MATVQGEEQKKIGELIRQQRKYNKMTQLELGEALGVGMQAVSDYEKGKVKSIPFEKRVKLAGILDIPIAELLYSDEKNSTNQLTKLKQLISYMAHHDKSNIESLEHISTELRNKIADKINYTSEICGRVEKIQMLSKELLTIAGNEKFDKDFNSKIVCERLENIISTLAIVKNKLQ